MKKLNLLSDYVGHWSLDISSYDSYTPTYFHAIRAPEITICSYLSRLKALCEVSDACWISSIIYIDRLSEFANKHTIHRLLLASLLVSSKYLEDYPLRNSTVAEVGGIDTKELNILELQLLYLLEYDLYISDEEFNLFCEKLKVSGIVH